MTTVSDARHDLDHLSRERAELRRKRAALITELDGIDRRIVETEQEIAWALRQADAAREHKEDCRAYGA